MNKSKILITEALPHIDKELKILRKYAEVELAKSTEENYLSREAVDAEIIMVVYGKITKKIVDSAKRLRGIVRYGIGVDNIDLAAATERGIPIANVPDYSIEAVADYAFAVLLSLDRRLLQADRLIRTGRYHNSWTSPPPILRGTNLEGKTLGIIGLGRIGKSVAARAKGFNMKVVAYDPFLKKEDVQGLGVSLVDLDKLLSSSDFVSIHAPLLPNTRHLISHNQLKSMKKTAYLINPARGSLVDEKALYQALKEGWIAGAGLDVYEKEPPDSNNPLLELGNVLLTPHIAWYTEEALQKLEMSAVNEAIRILKGQLPKNLVNKQISHLCKDSAREKDRSNPARMGRALTR